jgi:hypothetical protein
MTSDNLSKVMYFIVHLLTSPLMLLTSGGFILPTLNVNDIQQESVLVPYLSAGFYKEPCQLLSNEVY